MRASAAMVTPAPVTPAPVVVLAPVVVPVPVPVPVPAPEKLVVRNVLKEQALARKKASMVAIAKAPVVIEEAKQASMPPKASMNTEWPALKTNVVSRGTDLDSFAARVPEGFGAIGNHLVDFNADLKEINEMAVRYYQQGSTRITKGISTKTTQ
jgi:hypothetical protein